MSKWIKDLETVSVNDLNTLNLPPEQAEIALKQFCKGAEWGKEYRNNLPKRMRALITRLEQKKEKKSSYHLSLPEIYLLLNHLLNGDTTPPATDGDSSNAGREHDLWRQKQPVQTGPKNI